MVWEQFGIMIVTFVGLFIWSRTESRSDIRHMDAKLESNRNLAAAFHQENLQLIEKCRQENIQLIETCRQETNALINAIRQDMKDFHGRLCAIEERNKK